MYKKENVRTRLGDYRGEEECAYVTGRKKERGRSGVVADSRPLILPSALRTPGSLAVWGEGLTVSYHFVALLDIMAATADTESCLLETQFTEHSLYSRLNTRLQDMEVSQTQCLHSGASV